MDGTTGHETTSATRGAQNHRRYASHWTSPGEGPRAVRISIQAAVHQFVPLAIAAGQQNLSNYQRDRHRDEYKEDIHVEG